MTTAKLTPMRAIRAKCLDCTCNQVKEVRECCDKDCALRSYRMGHRPKEVSVQPQGELGGKPATSEGVFHAGGHNNDGDVT